MILDDYSMLLKLRPIARAKRKPAIKPVFALLI